MVLLKKIVGVILFAMGLLLGLGLIVLAFDGFFFWDESVKYPWVMLVVWLVLLGLSAFLIWIGFRWNTDRKKKDLYKELNDLGRSD